MKKVLIAGITLCLGIAAAFLLWRTQAANELSFRSSTLHEGSAALPDQIEAARAKGPNSESVLPLDPPRRDDGAEDSLVSEAAVVSNQFQDLYADLISGDAEAGRRLWQAMHGCTIVPLNRTEIDNLEEATRAVEDPAIAMRARLELSIAETKYQERCRFFSQPQRDMYFEILERSARAGDDAAAIEYFKAGPSTSSDDPFQEVHRAAQAKKAYELIHLAVERGSTEALPALARAEQHGLYGSPDPVAAYAALYAQVLAHGETGRFVDVYLSQLSEWEENLSTEQRQQAIRQAEKIAKSCCA